MTMPTRLRPFRLALAPLLVLGLSAPVAFAQEEDETIQPRPSEMAPKSAQALLTAIASAGDRLVAVGSRGHVLVSADGGSQWKQVPVPVRGLLTEVRFVGAQTGWAVGHDATILKTIDGGESWTLQHFDASQ